jgi:hypothetical protein
MLVYISMVFKTLINNLEFREMRAWEEELIEATYQYMLVE